MQGDKSHLLRTCLIVGGVIVVGVVVFLGKSGQDADNVKVEAELARIPTYDVDVVCKKEAAADRDTNADLAQLGLQADLTAERRTEIAQQCIAQEQESFDALKTAWPRAADEVQTACLTKVSAPRWKFYTQLGMCVDEVTSSRLAAAHPPFQAPVVTFKR